MASSEGDKGKGKLVMDWNQALGVLLDFCFLGAFAVMIGLLVFPPGRKK